MSNIFSENPLWSIGICITLFTVVAVHRLSIHRSKNEHFRKKASEFEKVIKNEFSEIYPIPSNWPENIDGYFRNKFPVIQSAVAEFREILSKNERASFDKAWFIYRLGEDGREIDKQCYHQYMDFRSPDIPYKDPKETFHENVSRLLSFTNKT